MVTLEVTWMEMERINDNLIKVSIDAVDLDERGVNFLDLVSGQENIERFFYSILEEVDVDRHFRESEAVTFQVIPNKKGLELYISRNNFENPEEFFSEEMMNHLFKQKDEDKEDSPSVKKTDQESLSNKEQLENFDLVDYLKKEFSEELNETDLEENENFRPNEDVVVRFETINDFISLAKDMVDYDMTSNLYYMSESYYLALDEVSEAVNDTQLHLIILKMFDYGQDVTVSEAYLQEHGRLIRKTDAITFFADKF